MFTPDSRSFADPTGIHLGTGCMQKFYVFPSVISSKRHTVVPVMHRFTKEWHTGTIPKVQSFLRWFGIEHTNLLSIRRSVRGRIEDEQLHRIHTGSIASCYSNSSGQNIRRTTGSRLSSYKVSSSNIIIIDQNYTGIQTDVPERH